MNPAQILPGLRPAASILFIRLRSLGDILLSTPLYAALKAWRPDLQLSALVEEPYQELLLRNPDLKHVFSVPSSENPPYQGGKAPQALGGVPLEDAVQFIEGHPPAPPSKGGIVHFHALWRRFGGVGNSSENPPSRRGGSPWAAGRVSGSSRRDIPLQRGNCPFSSAVAAQPGMKNSSGRTALSLLAARMAVLRRIRLEGFDCCINLHGGSTSGWFTWLSRATYRVGLRNFRHRFCYNVRIELKPKSGLESKQHTVEHQMQWLHSLGMPEAAISPLQVFPDPGVESRVEARLMQQGIDPTASYCVIQPTSKFYTKEWIPRGFAEIADYLGTQFGYRTVLTGGPGEMQKLKCVADNCQTAPAILNEISISELMWVIKRAKLFIGNDSGPTHLAAAFNIPIIVLFGSSDSQVWHPWKVIHQVVQNPFECNPCPGYRCLVYEEPKCILSITTSQVKQAIERLLPVC